MSLIKTMNLINKKNRFLPIHPQIVFRLLHNLLHILFPGNRRIQLPKICTRRVGNHSGEGRLPRPRWAVKDDGAQLVRLNGTI